ncbi:hypothetical protein U91I_03883 [alpha proteobacterium U9-1i]|nr:hypothetical protein U91I_03883 [alpha proteobacterium U9-1i]
MDSDLTNLLISVLPMLLLIGTWFFFMRAKGGDDFTALERRKVQALERIATALEKHG